MLLASVPEPSYICPYTIVLFSFQANFLDRSGSQLRQRIHFLIVFATDASHKVSNQMCRISNPFCNHEGNFSLNDTHFRQYLFTPYNNHKSTSVPRCCSTHLHCGTFAARVYCLVHWYQLPWLFLILPKCISSHNLGLCTTEWLIADRTKITKSLSLSLASFCRKFNSHLHPVFISIPLRGKAVPHTASVVPSLFKLPSRMMFKSTCTCKAFMLRHQVVLCHEYTKRHVRITASSLVSHNHPVALQEPSAMLSL